MGDTNKRGGIEAWNTKYNYGLPINTDTLTQEEYEQCAREWSEGDKNLEQLLYTCLIKGIKTVACCSGHNGEMSRGRSWHPYISFTIDKKNESIIDSIATYFKDFDGVELTYNPEKHIKNIIYIPPKVCFAFPVGTKSEVFIQMNEICEQYKKDEFYYDIDENFSNIREIIENSDVYEISYKRKKMNSEFLIRMEKNNNLNNMMKELKLKKVGTDFLFYYIGENEINRRDENQVKDLFRQIKNKLLITQDYVIDDESLEKIAKRRKKISIKDFFNNVKDKIKEFFSVNEEEIEEENIKGE